MMMLQVCSRVRHEATCLKKRKKERKKERQECSIVFQSETKMPIVGLLVNVLLLLFYSVHVIMSESSWIQ